MDDISSRDFEDLLEVGIALSSEHDLHVLLTMILSEARRFAGADAGTLYLVKGKQLQAVVAQCQTFVDRWGQQKADSVFQSFSIPISTNSIGGAAAATKEVINISDVQNQPPDSPFKYSPDFDRQNDYSTHSNLAVPMLNPRGEVIGVLQLINAMEAGKISEFSEGKVKLTRALASQAAVSIQNTLLAENLRDAHLETLHRLGIAAEWRDKETANHITRVSHYSRLMAEELGWDPIRVQLLYHASPMHDVGKLGIPDAILHKPGKLTPEERSVMEKHSIIGARIMADADNEVMRMSYSIALGHHEKYDGSGYPCGIAGEKIPMESRIVALADVYDALSCKRYYKPAFPQEKVVAIIKEENGKHFDPKVVDAFFACFDKINEIREKYEDTEKELATVNELESLEAPKP